MTVTYDTSRVTLVDHPLVQHKPVSYTHLDVYKRQALASRTICSDIRAPSGA